MHFSTPRIFLVLLALALSWAGRVVAQSSLPSACVGTTVRYGVKGGNGHSDFEWKITAPDGTEVPASMYQLMARGDSIEVAWSDNLTSGVYMFTVLEHTDDGCTGDPYSQDVIINSPQIFIPISNNLLDEGLGFCFNSFISLDPGTGFRSYLWQDSTTNQVYYTGEAGTFTVRLVNADYSCSYDSARIERWALPIVDLGRDTSILFDQKVEFNAYNPDFNIYNWSTGENSPSITVYGKNGTQTIWLAVTDMHGCQNSDTVIVKTGRLDNLKIPAAFTPNGDGYNDTWVFPAPDPETGASIRDHLTDVDVRVYNRYGRLMWRSTGLPRDWDGRATNGKPLPMDSYHYIIKFNYEGGTYTYKGSVTIIR